MTMTTTSKIPCRLIFGLMTILSQSVSLSAAAFVETLFDVSQTQLSRTQLSSSTQSRSLIIGGEDAPKGRYPYFMTLDHYCGGALIAPDMILTAGHCQPPFSVQPHVGRYSFDDDNYEAISIVTTVRHPDFDRIGDDEFIHDFVLIQLATPSTAPVVRINRNPHLPRPHQDVVAMGVGWTNPDYESRANRLQEVVLQYSPNDECEASHGRHKSYKNRIFPSHLCTTGGPHNERDGCNYDSGSPIIIPGRRAQSDTLVALVSWGEWCADPFFPGVNARVSDVSDWIDATVCALSNHNNNSEFCPWSWSNLWKKTIAVIKRHFVLFLVLFLVSIMLSMALCIHYVCFRRKMKGGKPLKFSSQTTTYESIESVEVTA